MYKGLAGGSRYENTAFASQKRNVSRRWASMSAPIVLLSCVKFKRGQRCRAGEMYTSPLFQKMMAYAKSLNPKRIFILSARYGLLSPDDSIEHYEQTLKNMKTAERRLWAERVIAVAPELQS